MIQINLLPVRVRKRKSNVMQFVYAYGLLLFLTLSVIAYLWISQSNEITALNTRVTRVKQEVNQYAKYDAMLKELKQKKDIVDKKRTIAVGLQKDRDTAARLLALLSIYIPPEEMWFDKFSQSSNTVTLDGMAISNEAIAEFMRNLESSPYVEKGSVNLTHSRQKSMSNMKLREFQVTYRFFPYSDVQKKIGEKKS